MPGYGILDADKGRGLLPWNWATERLLKSRNYWLVTTREDGRPHVMTVWGVWQNDAFYFSTGSLSRKARNLAANPMCVVSIERADETVIVEGIAQQVTIHGEVKHIADEYKTKYQENIDPNLGPVYVIRPHVAFGFIGTPEEFTGSATRWQFDYR